MTKILFVSALAAELKIVKQEIKKLNSRNLEFSFLQCWMWNYNTIFNLTKYLEKNNQIDFIVNIWVCGYIPLSQPFPPREKGEKVQKLIQVWRIKNFANLKEKIIPNFINFANVESILSSEQIISEENILKDFWENFVDMESYWFELVAEKYNLPRIILKVPVDKVWEETKNFDFNKAKNFLKENINYEKLVLEIEKFLENTSPQPSPLEERGLVIKNKILDYYKWTFSEKIILEKELNKFFALELWDLEEFFEENNNLEKKKFLNKLKNIK